jgi:hypothetical protein
LRGGGERHARANELGELREENLLLAGGEAHAREGMRGGPGGKRKTSAQAEGRVAESRTAAAAFIFIFLFLFFFIFRGARGGPRRV